MALQVAVGLIINRLGQVLITQRPSDALLGGLWEFPGGKIEDNESSEDALIRELNEELGISVKHQQYLFDVEHKKFNKHVLLHIFLVKTFSGQASCQERQQGMQWIYPCDLEQFQFPEANQAIISWLNKQHDGALV